LDHDHIKAQEVIGRYVAGRLSESEETQFESHLVDCPTCTEAVECEMSLRDGLGVVAADPGAWPEKPTAATRSPRSAQAFVLLRAAAAVLLAVAVGLGVWLSRSTAERDAVRAERDQLQRRAREAEQSVQSLERRLAARPSADPAPPASREGSIAPVAVFALVTDRGPSSADAAPINQIQIEKGARQVVFSMEIPPATGAGHYEVVLKDAAARPLWSGGPFPPSSPDSLGVAVDRALLPDGAYILDLSRRSPAGALALIGRYTFRVATQ